MRFKLFSFLFLLTGCSHQSEYCTATTVDTLQKINLILTQQMMAQQKQLINEEQITVDTAKIRQAIKQLHIDLKQVTASSGSTCQAHLEIQFPDKILKEANLSADLFEEPNVQANAAYNNLIFQQNQLSQTIVYSIDAQKKVVLPENLTILGITQNTLFDALALPMRQIAIDAAQEQVNRSYEAELKVAEQEFIESNKELKQIWVTTTAQVRNELWNDQHLWLRKRNLACQENGEIEQIKCKTQMTQDRIYLLEHTIQQLELAFS